MQEFYHHVLGQAEIKRTVAETNNLLLLYIVVRVLGMDYGGGIVEWKTKDQ